jgi:hypothetical protein
MIARVTVEIACDLCRATQVVARLARDLYAALAALEETTP